MRGRAWIVILVVMLLQACAISPKPTLSSAEKKEKDQRTAEAYVRLGLGYLKTGRSEEAVKPLQRAMELAPDDTEVLNAWAMMYAAQGEKALAEDAFNNAIRKHPDDARLHNNFGAFLFSIGKTEQGCTEVQKAAADPMYAQRSQAFENLGRCALMQNDLTTARDHYKRAVQLSPLSAEAWYTLAQVNYKLSDNKEAATDYAFFLRLVKRGYARQTDASLDLGKKIAQASGDQSLLNELNNWTQPATPGASE
ncbi:type IV pilus biogenesis/stability protein PilW [Pokkaliibacter sp. CJK22405]|uniref:type IV pilus biogenesis/stability protein PilW n=1 Tax=Pokkaliibacter sp. CJK22405 TaxID=3384615 RepID=UPI0039855840